MSSDHHSDHHSSHHQSSHHHIGKLIVDTIANHPKLDVILFAFALAVTLMLASFGYCCFQSRKRKKLRAATRRVATMSFDLEGGSPAAGAPLPPGILDACAKGDVFAIKAWIADERCVIDAASKEGSLTALHAAAKAGHAHVIRLLVEAGADALVVDSDLQVCDAARRCHPHLLHSRSAHFLRRRSPADAAPPRRRRRPRHVRQGAARRRERPERQEHGEQGARANIRRNSRLSLLCAIPRNSLALTVSPLSSPAQTALDLAEEGRHMGALRMMRLVLERREANGSNGAAHRRAK